MISTFNNDTNNNKEANFIQILLEENYNKVYKLAISVTLDPELSKDIAQETFTNAFIYIYTLRDKEKFTSWIRKMTINVCKKMMKDKYNYCLNNSLLDQNFSNYEYIKEYSNITDIGIASFPEKAFGQKEIKMEITKCIENLDGIERVILYCRYYENLHHSEIAYMIGIKEGAICIKTFKIKEKIYKQLADYFKFKERCIHVSKEIDSIIKETIREYYNNIECPPSNEIWSIFYSDIIKRRRKMMIKRYKTIAAVLLTITMSVMFLWYKKPVMAFTSEITQIIEQIAHDILKINISINKSKNINNIDDPRIDELQKEISFNIKVPTYMLDEFSLSDANITCKFVDKEVIKLLFIDNSIPENKNCFEITQQSFPFNTEATINLHIGNGVEVEHVNKKGVKYTFIGYEDDYNILLWSYNDIWYSIDGNLAKKDILKIAQTMK